MTLFGTDVFHEAREILRGAIAGHEPDFIYAGFSGGHDSLCATRLAAGEVGFSGCLHVNTGIGIEQTRTFVRETCAMFGWPLKEYSPPPGHSYRDIVLKHGFPGPYAHRFMYSRLKERALRQFMNEHSGTVMLVTGVRAAESRRRMGSAKPVQRRGRMVWVAPIIHWSSDDKAEYLVRENLPENPVVKLMCYSGECLCGAYARPGELEELRLWYPDAAAQIEDLQRAVAETGNWCRWGEAPPAAPTEHDPQQIELDEAFCWSCNAKRGA